MAVLTGTIFVTAINYTQSHSSGILTEDIQLFVDAVDGDGITAEEAQEDSIATFEASLTSTVSYRTIVTEEFRFNQAPQ
jgi:hypothetical protein